MDRTYDVVVLGATGFTGGLVAAEFARQFDGSDRPWAIAGRSPARLEKVRDRLVEEGSAYPVVEVVDSHADADMDALAASTRVLVTTVGPFAEHGESAVRACATQGTDYVDSTGEPRFVDMSLQRYDADARASGARIVHACGFDSIPADLGTRFTVARLPADVPITVRAFVRGAVRPSGGTLASLLDELGAASVSSFRSKPRRDGHRTATALPPTPTRVQQIGGVGLPMPVLDVDVVLRSAKALHPYGPDFRYGQYVHMRNPLTAAGLGIGLAGLAAAAKVPPVRERLKRLRPQGEGPSQAELDGSWFETTFYGQAGGHEVITKLSGHDPGYGGTAKMMCQAALSLLDDDLPETAGVVTTAEVFEGGFLERRLENEGTVHFEVVTV